MKARQWFWPMPACADGARITAKSKALRIKLRAFMIGSLEYNQQQIDFAIKSCASLNYLVLGEHCIVKRGARVAAQKEPSREYTNTTER